LRHFANSVRFLPINRSKKQMLAYKIDFAGKKRINLSANQKAGIWEIRE